MLKRNIAPFYNPKISVKYDNKQLLDEAEHDQLRTHSRQEFPFIL